MDLDHDLAIKISADLIIKEFECPVCFETINEAMSTKCGHIFCNKCIEECLNRQHECPNCKHETTADQLVPLYVLDKIIKTLLDEKEKAAKEYYEAMCNLSKNQAVSTSPIEAVFKKSMKNSFLEFEKYFEDLRNRKEKLKNKVKTQGLSEAETVQKVKEIEENYQRSLELVVESYERHMQSVSPSLDLLPVRLFIKIPKKNVVINSYVPKTHTKNDIKLLIFDYFQSKGDPVQDMSEGNFILHSNLNENPIQILSDGPIGNHDLTNGNTIFFDGEIVLKSDEPKDCFTRNFVKGNGMKTDYYSCFECNSNWICLNCALVCHLGHKVSIAVPNHEPTWACCYCVKKGLCRIPNNKKK